MSILHENNPMNMDTYELKLMKADIYKKLVEGEAQLDDDASLIDGEEVFSKLRGNHGNR